MKQAKGTHRSMGTKGGCSAGMESGCAEVTSFKASNSVETTAKSDRPKPVHNGSIAAK